MKKPKKPVLTNARPKIIRAAVVAVLVLIALVVAQHFQNRVLTEGRHPSTTERALFYGAAAFLLIGGIIAVRLTAGAIRTALEERPDDGRGAAPAFVVSVVGYVIVLLSALGVMGVNLQGLLLGGAVTGVVLGIAAQQTLGNFFAGVVLLAVRPFTIGEEVVLRSAPLGGEYKGRVTDMSLFYVKMTTEMGPVALPNAGVLAAAVGPGARLPKGPGDEEGESQPDPGPQHGGTPQ
jgi:small-conductance mechanosensitive channel